MLTEFRGHPVAGGTFPALIWKTFMEHALPYLHEDAGVVPVAARSRTASPSDVVSRDGQLAARQRRLPQRATPCSSSPGGAGTDGGLQAERGDVPHVVGSTLATREGAARRAAARRRTYVYKPAEPLQRLDVVVGQYPEPGHALRRTTR